MKKTSRILAIDSIRGLSAIAIACVYHLATVPFVYQSGFPLGNIGMLYWIYQRGWVFVELFLVISGYTSFVSYSQKIDGGLSFRKYAVRRMIRIYPLMLGTLVFAAVGILSWYSLHDHSWWSGSDAHLNLTTFVFSALGLQSFFQVPQSWNFPSWSLSVFFVCWILFFLMLRITRNKTQLRLPINCIMILIGISLILNPPTVQIAFLNGSAARGYISFFGGG